MGGGLSVALRRKHAKHTKRQSVIEYLAPLRPSTAATDEKKSAKARWRMLQRLWNVVFAWQQCVRLKPLSLHAVHTCVWMDPLVFFTNQLEAEPTDVDAAKAAAMLAMERAQYDVASRLFVLVTQWTPDDASAYFHRALCLLALQDPPPQQEIQDCLRKTIELSTEDPMRQHQAMILLGHVLIAEHKFPEAATWFQQTTASDTNQHAICKFQHAFCAFAMTESETATVDLSEAQQTTDQLLKADVAALLELLQSPLPLFDQ